MKPMPPLGYSDVARACVCNIYGLNCQWAWVGVRGSTDTGNQAGILNSIANYNPSRSVAENQNIEAQTELARQQAAIAAQQARALQLRNQAIAWEGQRQYDLLRVKMAMERHPDFKAVTSQNLPASPAMTSYILWSSDPAELVYWLGKHPDEDRRIARLGAWRARRALHKIEKDLQ